MTVKGAFHPQLDLSEVSSSSCLSLSLPPSLSPGSADSVVVLSQPEHELVAMAAEGHAYGEDDVVALL